MTIPLAYLTSSKDGSARGLYDDKPIRSVEPLGAPEEIQWVYERNWPSPSDIEVQVREHLQSKPFKDKANAFIAKKENSRFSQGLISIMFCNINIDDYERVRVSEIQHARSSEPMGCTDLR